MTRLQVLENGGNLLRANTNKRFCRPWGEPIVRQGPIVVNTCEELCMAVESFRNLAEPDSNFQVLEGLQ